MVEGVKPVRELLASDVAYDQIFTTEDLPFLPDNVVGVSNKDLERLSSLKSPNKVVAVAKIPTPVVDYQNVTILLLDGLKDPGNLGTIIRTAKWFGVSDIICINDCVDAYDKKVVQSTMGALFHVNLVYEEESVALNHAKENGYTIAGTEMGGESIFDKELEDKTMLVIGSESHGMSKEVREACDVLLSIPNQELEQKIESLNAAISAGIVLAELNRKRRG